MVGWEFDISELEALALVIPKMIPIIDDEVSKAMAESGLIITAAVASRILAKSSDTGQLAASVESPAGWTETGALHTMEGVAQAANKVTLGGISTSVYSNFVEFGTKAHMPPIEPLELWARRKLGITDDRAARGAAWGIAMNIARRGTYAKGNFFLAWHHDGAKRKVANRWKKVPVNVVQRWEREAF